MESHTNCPPKKRKLWEEKEIGSDMCAEVQSLAQQVDALVSQIGPQTALLKHIQSLLETAISLQVGGPPISPELSDNEDDPPTDTDACEQLHEECEPNTVHQLHILLQGRDADRQLDLLCSKYIRLVPEYQKFLEERGEDSFLLNKLTEAETRHRTELLALQSLQSHFVQTVIPLMKSLSEHIGPLY